MFINYLQSNPLFYITWIIIIIFSVCVHEYAHARAAYYFGDDLPALKGHLTLNPLIQMGRFSLFALFLIGIAWGSVPTNPYAYKRPAHRALMIFAGPASNLCLAIGFSFIGAIVYFVSQNEAFFQFFITGSTVNCLLFIFNLLPIPSFDGWGILSEIFPQMKRLPPQQMNFVVIAVLAIMILTPVFRVLWHLAETLSDLLFSIIAHILNFF